MRVLRCMRLSNQGRWAALCCVSVLIIGQGWGQELVTPPKGIVHYELSNVRAEENFGRTRISFDYRVTEHGEGTAQLAARSDHGATTIIGGLQRIQQSGTIVLEDMFGSARRILNRGEQPGVEFYFVVGMPLNVVSPSIQRPQLLVSNSVKHGHMNTTVNPRPLTTAEADAFELARKAKLPPESVPPGYQRSTTETKLIPGAPVLYGSLGEWKPGTVVAVSSRSWVRVLPDNEHLIRTVNLKDWIAVSDQTLRDIQTNPSQFSINVRTLPDGNLVLDDDMVVLPPTAKLAKGTPLRRERLGNWEDVYFLGADQANVRVVVKDRDVPRVEFLKPKQLAIRNQTLADLKDASVAAAFAENVAEYESRTSAGGMGASSLGATKRSFPAPANSASTPQPRPAAATPTRTWSDESGNFTVDASLVKQDAGQVFLKRVDGRMIEVPIAKLSSQDRDYLEKIAAVSSNPFENIVEATTETSQVNYDSLLLPINKFGGLTWGAKSVALSPNGAFLLVGRNAASASLFDVASGRTLVDSGRMEHMGDIGVCGFTPNSTRLLFGGYKGVFEVYAIDAKGNLQQSGQHAIHEGNISALAISGDSEYAFSGDEKKVARYWKLSDGEILATIDGFNGRVKATCISPDGKLLATDGETLKIYSAAGAQLLDERTVGRSHASGQAAAFSRDGKTLAVGDGYNIHVYATDTGQKQRTLEGKEINWSMCFAPDGRHLFSGGNGVVFVWDCEQGNLQQKNLIGESFYVKAIGVSRDGTCVAAPCDHSSVVVLRASQ